MVRMTSLFTNYAKFEHFPTTAIIKARNGQEKMYKRRTHRKRDRGSNRNNEPPPSSKDHRDTRKSIISSDKIFQKYGTDFMLPCKRHKHLLPELKPINWDQALMNTDNNSDKDKEIGDGDYWKSWRAEHGIEISNLFMESAVSIERDSLTEDKEKATRKKDALHSSQSQLEPTFANLNEKINTGISNSSNKCYSKTRRRRRTSDVDTAWLSKGWYSARNNEKGRRTTSQSQLFHYPVEKLCSYQSISSDRESVSLSTSVSQYSTTQTPVAYNVKVVRQRDQQSGYDEDEMSDELLEYESSSSLEASNERQRQLPIDLSKHRVLTLQHSSNEAVKELDYRERKPPSKLKKHHRFSVVQEPIRSSFDSMPILSNIRKKQTTLDESFTSRTSFP